MEPYRIDPCSCRPDRPSVNAVNAMIRDYLLDFMHSELAGRPDLIEKVMPDYPAMGKRILQDNGSWFMPQASQCRAHPNRDRADHSRGDRDGRRQLHPADAICYATGFRHNQFLAFDMTGRGGVSLHEQWGEEPTAYLGITVPNFPNLFLCYGPGTNLAHSAGLFFHAEFQTTCHGCDPPAARRTRAQSKCARTCTTATSTS